MSRHVVYLRVELDTADDSVEEAVELLKNYLLEANHTRVTDADPVIVDIRAGAQMSRQRHTTKREDAEYLLRRYAEATQPWSIGDRCLSYNGQVITTVKEINGAHITLATGETMHRSHMRKAPKEV